MASISLAPPSLAVARVLRSRMLSAQLTREAAAAIGPLGRDTRFLELVRVWSGQEAFAWRLIRRPLPAGARQLLARAQPLEPTATVHDHRWRAWASSVANGLTAGVSEVSVLGAEQEASRDALESVSSASAEADPVAFRRSPSRAWTAPSIQARSVVVGLAVAWGGAPECAFVIPLPPPLPAVPFASHATSPPPSPASSTLLPAVRRLPVDVLTRVVAFVGFRSFDVDAANAAPTHGGPPPRPTTPPNLCGCVSRTWHAAFVRAQRALHSALVTPRWRAVGRVMGAATSLKIAFHAPRELRALARCGVEVEGEIADPRVAFWMLDPDRASRDLGAHAIHEAEDDEEDEQEGGNRPEEAQGGGADDGSTIAALRPAVTRRARSTSEWSFLWDESVSPAAVAEADRAVQTDTTSSSAASSSPVTPYLALRSFLGSSEASGRGFDVTAFLQSRTAGSSASVVRANAERVRRVWVLMSVLGHRLRALALDEPFRRVEMPVARVLAAMEDVGLRVDPRVLLDARRRVASAVELAENGALVLLRHGAPSSFDSITSSLRRTSLLQSSVHIARALRALLGVAPTPRPAGATQSAAEVVAIRSGSAEELDAVIASPRSPAVARDFAAIVKVVRRIQPHISFADRMIDAVRVRPRGDARPETVIVPCVDILTGTGRLLMRGANLQGIPKPFSLPAEPSSSSSSCSSSSSSSSSAMVSLRGSLVARPGCVLLAADFSQIELRLLAHLSADPTLLRLFAEDRDVFCFLASQWFGGSADAVAEEVRAQAKTLTYGLLYGMSAASLSAAMAVSRVEAERRLQAFERTFPRAVAFLRHVPRICQAQSFVETILGRRRYLPHVTSSDASLRHRAFRQAVNTVCQASAADVIKLAMANILARLKALGGGSRADAVAGAGGGDEQGALGRNDEARVNGLTLLPVALEPVARIVLQIHDELVLEVQREWVEAVAVVVRDSMESSVQLRVPLRVKMSVGRTWGAMEPWDSTERER